MERRSILSAYVTGEMVGREHESARLLNQLSYDEPAATNNGEVVSVISLWGMEGIGKTTLAKRIYNHEEVIPKFDARMWVSVSEIFDVKSILNKLGIESPTKGDHALEDEIEILQILGEKLGGKRYLVILDDVWNEDRLKWELFIDCLKAISTTEGNYVVVTTRSRKVASIVGTLPWLQLGKLTNDECWEIFQQEAFASGGPVKTSDLQAIGREIVKKCSGLPLAAVVLGRMLHSKMEISDWRAVEKSDIWNFPDVESPILGMLKPSFDNFPNDDSQHSLVTTDFSYSAGRGHESAQLLNQKSDPATNGQVVECELPRNLEEPESKLASDVSVKEFAANTPTKSNSLRVLKLSGSAIDELPPSIGEMKNLTYIDVSYTKIRELPESITQLTNLLTLRLSNCYNLKELPKGFSKLLNLRHLYMEDDDDDEIREKLMPMGLGKLTCLQTLPFFVVGSKHGCRIEELGCLSNLTGKLKLYNLERVRCKQEAEEAQLAAKVNICRLVLHWSCERDEGVINDENVLEGLKLHGHLKALTIKNFLGVNFAPWMSNDNLQSLVKITLRNCRRCQLIPSLGQLPCLMYVKVVGLDGVCHIGDEFYGVGAKVFPELRKLTIKEMPRLEVWSKPPLGLSSTLRTLFPRLEELSISDCPQLISFPDYFPALKDLFINDCKKLSSLGVLQDDGVFSLSSLQTLRICRCEGLTNFWLKGLFFSGLTRLERLEIGEFSKELEYFPWPSVNKTAANNPFVSTKALILYGWASVKFLPTQIQHFLNLTDLTIQGFSGLEALPDWLGNLSCLQLLRITKCCKLMNFPSVEAMDRMTNLRCLSIVDCPCLGERCSTNIGPEWCKVSRIPCIEIDGVGVHHTLSVPLP